MENDELPDGWKTVTLSDICQVERGITFPHLKKAVELPKIVSLVYGLQASRRMFLWNNLIYVPQRYVKSERKLVYQNDILISMANSRELVGKVSFVTYLPTKSTFGAFIVAIRVFPGIDPKFLFYFFRFDVTLKKLRKTASQTVNIANLSLDDIYTTNLSLPPLPEQHRIVSVIEQQFSRFDAAVTSLQHARAKLKRQRAAILKSAVEGTLTADWRAQHPASEKAEQLLQRILHERRAKWEAEQLAKMRVKGVTPKDDSWKKTYKEPEPTDTTNLPEVQEGWMWATVEQVAVLVTDGDHNPPKRVPSGIPHLTARNIVHSHIDFSGCTFVTEDDAKKVFRRYQPLSGDLIVTTVGTIGRTAIVPDGIVFSPDRNLAAIRTMISYHFTRFLEYCLMSPDYQTIMANASGSTAQPHLYLSDLRLLSFPLPPLSEQEQIVFEVEARLSIIAQTELEVEVNLKRAERLRQTILAEAFAGRLLPQHPDDEPASVLLERIREERKGREVEKKGKNSNGRNMRIAAISSEPVQIDVEGVEQVELWEGVGG